MQYSSSSYNLKISLEFIKWYTLNITCKHISSVLGGDPLILTGYVMSKGKLKINPANTVHFAKKLWK